MCMQAGAATMRLRSEKANKNVTKRGKVNVQKVKKILKHLKMKNLKMQ